MATRSEVRARLKELYRTRLAMCASKRSDRRSRGPTWLMPPILISSPGAAAAPSAGAGRAIASSRPCIGMVIFSTSDVPTGCCWKV